MVQPLRIRGACIWDGRSAPQRDLCTSDVVLDSPAPGARTVDLAGYTLFPGLINAHDHLELNHYPRSRFRPRYDNAHQWGEDMNARLDTEPYKSLRAYPLWDRLFIGGLKNLLCGALTVVHHNPPYRELWHKDFPVRVLKEYGWAHSLRFNTENEIVRSYRATPPRIPWFIHLAEGTDAVAAGEYRRLKSLGCVGSNTVLVHAVGLRRDDFHDLAASQYGDAGVVLCPSTNLFLLGAAPNYTALSMLKHCGIGSDSRLTASGDLLDELRAAVNTGFEPDQAAAAVTYRGAMLARISPHMMLERASRADFIAVRADEADARALCAQRRADLALVVRGGVPRIGDPEAMAKFPYVPTVAAALDGRPKAIHRHLARNILRCQLSEPGLEVEALPRGFRLW